MILDPEAIGGSVGIVIELRLEHGDAPDQVACGRMAIVVGDVLAQLAPQRFRRHQIGTVAWQQRKLDAQARRGGPHRLGAVIRGTVPDHDELAIGDLGTQPAAAHRWCARHWRAHRAKSAPGPRCRDTGRRTRPWLAARVSWKQQRTAGRARPSHGRGQHPDGCGRCRGRPAGADCAGRRPARGGPAR